MSTSPQLSPLEQLGASVGANNPQPASPSTPQGNLSPLEQLGQTVNQSQPSGQGPDADEQKFLDNNPGYQFLTKDPRFPNRQPGVYPAGPGNEWRNDPNHPMHDTSQSPVDVLGAGHLAKQTAEWGAGSAALIGTAPLLGEAEGAVPSLVDKAKDVYEWAKVNPIKAAAVEGIARELGVDPFQLAHKVVKYGKNLFGAGGSQ